MQVQQEMTTEQALGLVTSVCAQYRGTLQEHQAIQQAITVLREAVTPKVEDEEVDRDGNNAGE